MCGLIGYSGKKEQLFDIAKIKFLMYANSTRGMDSTGMYNDGKVDKSIYSVDIFLENSKLIPNKLFLGHTRKRSVGSITRNTAHPFEFGSIIGAHNGTLSNHAELARLVLKLKHNEWDTDSQILIQLISKYKDLSFMKDLTGAAAIIWIDTRDGTLNFWRNYERPLWYAYDFSGNMYVSSIKESFDGINIKSDTVTDVEINTLYKIKNGAIKSKIKDIKSKTKTYPTSSGYSDGNYGAYGYANTPITKSYYNKTWALANVTSVSTKKDQYYFIEEVGKGAGFNYITIIGDDGKLAEVSKTFFEESIPVTKDDFGVLTEDRKSSNLKKGELVYCRGAEWVEGQKRLIIEKYEFDDREIKIPAYLVRPLLSGEFKSNKKVDKGIDNKDKKINLCEWEGDDQMISSKGLFTQLYPIVANLTGEMDKIIAESSIFTEEYLFGIESQISELQDLLVTIKNSKKDEPAD
jgi:predicted glutamine amidotransferase